MDETSQLHETLVALNEALLLGSVRQDEMTQAAEKLNEQLRAEIAARKQAEDRITASHKELSDLKAAFDKHAIVAVTDPLGRITDVNDKFCAISKYSRDELLGQDHRILNSGHHSKEFIRDLWATISSGQVWKGEICNRAKDGSVYWVDTTIVPFLNPKGDPYQYVAIRADITERKRVEQDRIELDQRLRDQQFYTRSLIEANIDALMTTDPGGVITDVNKQMEVLTGCTRYELIGAPFKDFFTDPERAGTAIARVLREGKVTNYELTAHARNGRETVVSYNASTFYDRDRKLQGVFAAARDITERRQFERALQEYNVELESTKAVAERANLAKSEFLSSMSHELRTPLHAILGFAQLLQIGSSLQTASQKESIEQILKAGWYLLELISEILDLSLIESGKLPVSLEPIALADVVRECEAMIEPEAQSRGISLTIPSLDRRYFVEADRTRLKQVFINLLSNAIKYNKAGGRVDVDYTVSAPGRIRLLVKDTGEGLTPGKLAQLFQPFNRLGRETGVEEGTGIGLVMSKRLVELMKGDIGAESTVGKGSVFWIELNLTAEPQLAVAAADPMAAAQAQVHPDVQLRTVLYVEDNPANLMLVEGLIARRADIRLLSAVDGEHSIELARATRPDVILMDINLPGISGFEVLNILRADPATAHIPVVALSANAMPLNIEKGLAAGFFRYLIKPIKVDQFMHALDLALEFSETDSAGAGRR